MANHFDYISQELALELNNKGISNKRANFVDRYPDLFNNMWQNFQTIDASIFFPKDYSLVKDPLQDETLIIQMKHCLILKYRYTNEDKAVVVNKWAKFLLQQAPNEKGWYHNYRKLLKEMGGPAPQPLITTDERQSSGHYSNLEIEGPSIFFDDDFPKCFCCGNRYPKYMQHTVKTCPRLHPDWVPRTCFNCAENGHKVDACPLPRRAPDSNYTGFVYPPREMRKREMRKRVETVVAYDQQVIEMIEALEAYENAHEPHYLLSIGNLHPKTTHQDVERYFDGYIYDSLIEGVGRERRAKLRFWHYRMANHALNNSHGIRLNGLPMCAGLYQV